MSRILVHDTLSHRPTALVQELLATRDLDFTWTTDLALFEAGCDGGAHTIALVLVHGIPTSRLAAVLGRVSSTLPVAALVEAPSADAVRALLGLGVREVFAEPIAPRRLVSGLLGMVHGYRGGTATPMQAVDPVTCTVRIAGGTEVPGRWCAVARGAFEVAIPHVVAEGTLVEVVGLPPTIRSAGMFGRVVHVDVAPGVPARLRCEALPVSDHAPVTVDSRGLIVEPSREIAPSVAPTVDAAPTIRVDAGVLAGMVALLLGMAGVGYFAAIHHTQPTALAPATTREVLSGIREAFR